ncbi:MAG: WXG100 family type VII secretion target [Microthrixaceae bacterium]
MARLGLDPEQMTALANTMKKEAGNIDAAAGRLDGKLRSTYWEGPDQKRFQGEWDGKHKKALKDAVKLLNEAASRINKEVSEQRQASGG